ncbi:glycoside hydrolase family 3 C-terminal domain-containing protein [Agreia sp. VKM Ac-1783]|uniref:beta-glucosidase family protein n=1 Tax=Agreia sp. VKM Ac-1783 TaxID=1938889 RepID=UPI000A2AC4F6|nr:glycoside hydrolase family 3 C-terminal domain-containing protein [Agreia sp. VKM Ac-1783]SMQ73673.1 beta-glucosidase [Agreia sp. VKM Ac-1783]
MGTLSDRVSDLTLDEKTEMLTGLSFWHTVAVPRLGIPSSTLTDGPHGVRLQGEEVDNLGIGGSAPATAFPTGSALGSSFDPELLSEIGSALGAEARNLGVDVLLGPGVNIKRSPLCGRNFEYFSEDPFVSGVLGAAWVQGVQSHGVGASVKHFAANNQETNRMMVSSNVDERTLREIYFPAFEKVVRKADPATVMCSYNKINGIYASENTWLLSDVLRKDWGFDGYVVSDWAAVVDPVAAVAAGLDLSMPADGGDGASAVREAVRAGSLSESIVDRAVGRQLSTLDRLVSVRSHAPEAVDFDAHHDLARRASVDSAVLLKNEGLLPLPLDASIAVIGEFARTPRFQGAGSSRVVPTRVDSALDEIRQLVGGGGTVTFSAGFTLDDEDNDERLLEEAVAAAENAGIAVMFLGLPDADESEGFDRTGLNIPAKQRELLKAVASVTPQVAVVLSNGGIVSAGELIPYSNAILEMWLGGQASGSAAAHLLFGISSPGGRLAETIPRRLKDSPAQLNFPGTSSDVLYGERIYVGYRYFDSVEVDVAFPFGHGLSYTSFAYSDLEVDVLDSVTGETRVSLTVTNEGSRSSKEVVQLYVSDTESTVDRPAQELQGFTKILLEPGQSRRVTIELDSRAFSYWHQELGRWHVEQGRFEIRVGSSSRDIRLTGDMWLEGEVLTYSLTMDSPVGQWLRDPASRERLLNALERLTGYTAAQHLETLRMVESLPVSRLPRILDQEMTEELRIALTPTDEGPEAAL